VTGDPEEVGPLLRELKLKNRLLEVAMEVVDDLATAHADDDWLRAAHRMMSRYYRTAGSVENRDPADQEMIVAGWREAWHSALTACRG